MVNAARIQTLTDAETLLELIGKRDAIVKQYKEDKRLLANGSIAEKLALYSMMQDKLQRINLAIYSFTGKEG